MILKLGFQHLFKITTVKAHDTKAMGVVPYEENSFYICDRGYNYFQRLYNIHNVGAYFVVRGKNNSLYRPMKWKRRSPIESGILSDAIKYMDDQLTTS